ncbi:hypothetical protein A3A66_00130 [Microgenomates group bacterium RIFCSPLOWO2_01_FULL_46_13]|nr:MAG: hypothetical protein A2783_03410 [Microgenomates group bacterium RIFCSPHIGHO2_01_FULL_45_11]OGV94427.1 MAG: hypothetical protein A3A66_00130 [Microgenomates group bacterium RIFCSPLOWO2_01_FULL_46_13]
MRIIRGKELAFIPASHELPDEPGSLKKVLWRREDLLAGRVQMINWAKMPVGKEFRAHYHEDMEEVFIVVSGRAEIKIGKERAVLERGDAVVIPMQVVHWMRNVGKREVEYIALGISAAGKGKTVVR